VAATKFGDRAYSIVIHTYHLGWWTHGLLGHEGNITRPPLNDILCGLTDEPWPSHIPKPPTPPLHPGRQPRGRAGTSPARALAPTRNPLDFLLDPLPVTRALNNLDHAHTLQQARLANLSTAGSPRHPNVGGRGTCTSDFTPVDVAPPEPAPPAPSNVPAAPRSWFDICTQPPCDPTGWARRSEASVRSLHGASYVPPEADDSGQRWALVAFTGGRPGAWTFNLLYHDGVITPATHTQVQAGLVGGGHGPPWPPDLPKPHLPPCHPLLSDQALRPPPSIPAPAPSSMSEPVPHTAEWARLQETLARSLHGQIHYDPTGSSRPADQWSIIAYLGGLPEHWHYLLCFTNGDQLLVPGIIALEGVDTGRHPWPDNLVMPDIPPPPPPLSLLLLMGPMELSPYGTIPQHYHHKSQPDMRAIGRARRYNLARLQRLGEVMPPGAGNQADDDPAPTHPSNAPGHRTPRGTITPIVPPSPGSTISSTTTVSSAGVSPRPVAQARAGSRHSLDPSCPADVSVPAPRAALLPETSLPRAAPRVAALDCLRMPRHHVQRPPSPTLHPRAAAPNARPPRLHPAADYRPQPRHISGLHRPPGLNSAHRPVVPPRPYQCPVPHHCRPTTHPCCGCRQAAVDAYNRLPFPSYGACALRDRQSARASGTYHSHSTPRPHAPHPALHPCMLGRAHWHWLDPSCYPFPRPVASNPAPRHVAFGRALPHRQLPPLAPATCSTPRPLVSHSAAYPGPYSGAFTNYRHPPGRLPIGHPYDPPPVPQHQGMLLRSGRRLPALGVGPLPHTADAHAPRVPVPSSPCPIHINIHVGHRNETAGLREASSLGTAMQGSGPASAPHPRDPSRMHGLHRPELYDRGTAMQGYGPASALQTRSAPFTAPPPLPAASHYDDRLQRPVPSAVSRSAAWRRSHPLL